MGKGVEMGPSALDCTSTAHSLLLRIFVDVDTWCILTQFEFGSDTADGCTSTERTVVISAVQPRHQTQFTSRLPTSQHISLRISTLLHSLVYSESICENSEVITGRSG